MCTSHVPCKRPAVIALNLGTLRVREAIIYFKKCPVKDCSLTLKSLLEARCLLTSKPHQSLHQPFYNFKALRWQAPQGTFCMHLPPCALHPTYLSSLAKAQRGCYPKLALTRGSWCQAQSLKRLGSSFLTPQLWANMVSLVTLCACPSPWGGVNRDRQCPHWCESQG